MFKGLPEGCTAALRRRQTVHLRDPGHQVKGDQADGREHIPSVGLWQYCAMCRLSLHQGLPEGCTAALRGRQAVHLRDPGYQVQRYQVDSCEHITSVGQEEPCHNWRSNETCTARQVL